MVRKKLERKKRLRTVKPLIEKSMVGVAYDEKLTVTDLVEILAMIIVDLSDGLENHAVLSEKLLRGDVR